jgi:modulator of FtsH protease
MENAYRPEAWHELYVMLGGSAAALAGLLFVAMSIHLDDVLKVPFLRTFARNNTIAMIVLVVRAAAILMPQSHLMLAVELILIDAFGVVMVSTVLVRDSRQMPHGRKLRAAAVALSNVLGVAGAVSLVAETGGGMYVITAAYLIFFCIIISSAWALMTGVYQAERAPKRR